MVEPARRSTVTMRRMRFACRITKATDTHSEHVIIITFPKELWLSERASVLCYTQVVCLVFFSEIV
jgi:hypothetical protein